MVKENFIFPSTLVGDMLVPSFFGLATQLPMRDEHFSRLKWPGSVVDLVPNDIYVVCLWRGYIYSKCTATIFAVTDPTDLICTTCTGLSIQMETNVRIK